MAVTERDVQRVVDAMNASAMQIVNQATVQTMRKEFTESCNKVVDQASAKFANIELHALELHETEKNKCRWSWTGVPQHQVDDRHDDARRRVCSGYDVPACVGIGGPRKQGSHAGPCDFSESNQGDRREAQYNGEEQYRKQQHNGTEWNVDEEIFARETRSQGRSRENWTSGARGGTMLQTSWTRAMSECSTSCTPSL